MGKFRRRCLRYSAVFARILKQGEDMDGLQKTVMYGYQMLMPKALIPRIGMSNIRMEHIILYIQYHQILRVVLNKKR